MFEEAIVIVFVNPAMGHGARVAVEIVLSVAKDFQAALSRAIEAAEEVEGNRIRYTGWKWRRPFPTLQVRFPARPGAVV